MTDPDPRDVPDVDEDLLDDLPPVGDLSAEEETLDPEDLGIEGLIGEGDEKVGLDDSVGLEDDAQLFALELPPDDAAGDEQETDLDAIPVEGVGGEDEYGWTQESAAAADEPWDPAELDIPSLTPLGRDDGGEEGVDDEFELGGDDGDSVPHLPPIRADLDDDDEPIDDPMLDAMVPPPRRPDLPGPYEDDVCVAVRLTPAIPIRSVLVTPRGTWAVGDAIFAIDGDAVERVVAGGLEERRALSLAAGDDGHRLVVGTDRGIARSVDRGERFGLSGALASGAFVVSREPGTDRIWAYSDRGALHRSDDLGGVWSGPLVLEPVVALVTPPGDGVVALCGGETSTPQLARSVDGGQRWAATDGPPIPLGDADHAARVSLAVEGSLVVVSSDADDRAPHLSTDSGRTWLRVPGLPPAQVVTVTRELGGTSIYAVHRSEDRAVVVRHRPDGGDAGMLLELTEPDARVEALVLDRDGDVTRLFVATSVGLYRVTVSTGAV